jgi:hypothetical protein
MRIQKLITHKSSLEIAMTCAILYLDLYEDDSNTQSVRGFKTSNEEKIKPSDCTTTQLCRSV